MTGNNNCADHKDHTNRIRRNEKDIQDLWRQYEKVNGRIDAMKNWVIAGMCSFVLQGIVVITHFVLQWIAKNP